MDDQKRFVMEHGAAALIAGLAEPVIEGLGCRLVRVIVSQRDGGTVQIMADRADKTLTIEHCTAISRQLSPLLDVHDPMPGGYRLEVSSPGIDRPLVRPSDFEDWAGYEVKVKTSETIEGRKRFAGVLDGFEDGEVRLKVKLDGMDEEQVLGFAASMVEDAKLVMTDELVKSALAGKDSQAEK